VCTTRADGGKSQVPYFDHPFGGRTREEFYQRCSTALERERVPGDDGGIHTGLPREGVVPSDLLPPIRALGIDTPVMHAPHRRVKTCLERRSVDGVTRCSGRASILEGTGTAPRTGRCHKRVTTAFREAEAPLLAPYNAYTSDIVLGCVAVTAGSARLFDSGRHLMGGAIRHDPSRRDDTPPCRASSGLARNGICRLPCAVRGATVGWHDSVSWCLP
jgi:hypothetical protein